MRTFLILFLMTIPLLADDSPFGKVLFDQLGFDVPDDNVIFVKKNGQVKWKKTPAPDTQAFWDEVAVSKDKEKVPPGYTVKKAMEDWNDMIVELKVNGKLPGNEEAAAKKMWKMIKKLFPHEVPNVP